MELKVIYQDNNLLVVDKPAGIVVFPEGTNPPAGGEKTLIDLLLEKYPDLKNAGEIPRYGISHRLDKDTSGILLVAKNDKTLEFLQKQFQTGKVIKKYQALVIGSLKTEKGTIETLIGRSPKDRRKQKAYLPYEPKSKGKRKTITKYRILEKFSAKGGSAGGGKDYTLIEVKPETGRKHQIRCHLSYLGHPIVGDKMYGFKNQPCPERLSRQFLHASYIKIQLPDGKTKEFKSELPEDLKNIINELKIYE